MSVTTCEDCGKEITFEVWPFCPHPAKNDSRSVMITRDEIPGGILLENYGPKPIVFYSHTERRKYMAEHGLREKEKYCPTPGTDLDPAGIPNPKGYMGAQTLENARILLERAGQKHVPFEGDGPTILRNTRVGVLSPEEVKDYV